MHKFSTRVEDTTIDTHISKKNLEKGKDYPNALH